MRVGERQRALLSLSEARIVVAGPLAIRERTPLYDPMQLKGGAEIELDDCLSRLVSLGYERVDRVSRHGEFAVRGGIVDVFPSTRRSPVRVEWWGDEIESVRAVSLATQRVVRELEGATVYAAREGALAILAAASGDDFPEEAQRGVRVPGLDRLLLGLNPISPRDLLPQGVEVWAEEPAEGLPEDATEDVVRELYDEALPEPDLRFVTITEGEEEETFDNHLGDAASITFDREMDQSLGENSGHVLAAIDEALNRIEEGTFGTCARCGNPIAEARLEAMPYATKCIDCKRLEERA